ncbi:MAG: glycerol-3-phosphate dehydrogenase C-terminal domain-containing protein, partial [Candidatus Competibacterales bacterium]|nr:glycerol-3-phosphate dehydrogenase C-terminal domain-containing protein [Candidatus Competibacterales bacterium]
PGGNLEEPSFLARKVHAAHSELSEDLVEHLVCLYGTEVETVLGYHRPDDKVLKTSRPALVAQARYAVEREAACRLADVVFRRMGIGHFGRVSPSALWELAIAMGRLLGWSITQTEREVEAVLAETQRFSGSESAPASD